MEKIIQALMLIIAFSFVVSPAIAKDSTSGSSKSSKSKSNPAKKTAKKPSKVKKSDKLAKPEKKAKPGEVRGTSKTGRKTGKENTSQSSDQNPSLKDSGKSGEKTSRLGGTEKNASSDKDKNNKNTKDSKNNSSSSTSDSATSDSASSENDKGSKKTSKRKAVKSALTGTNKAKRFKDITVNINKADAATLAYYLVGIGETRAKAIIKYRQKNGKFKNTEDLLSVPGIGEAIFSGLKKNVSPSKGETSVPKKTTPSKETLNKKK